MNKKTERKRVIRDSEGKFLKGTAAGPGRNEATPEEKLVKKAAREIIAEYKQALAEALPLIRPVLVAKAMEGDIPAIKELHDRVMDKAKQATDVTTNGKELPQPIINIQRDALHTDDSVQ